MWQFSQAKLKYRDVIFRSIIADRKMNEAHGFTWNSGFRDGSVDRYPTREELNSALDTLSVTIRTSIQPYSGQSSNTFLSVYSRSEKLVTRVQFNNFMRDDFQH